MDLITDVVVIGTGVAGLSLALKAAKRADVVLLTKREPQESATRYAQGGIATVLSAEDSFDLHVKDTLEAGAGLCNEEVVRMVVEAGPARIDELISLGVRFTKRDNDPNNSLDLHLEGGHSKRRVAHVRDLTGEEIERALLEAVRSHPRITLLPNHPGIDLITLGKLTRRPGPDRCLGLYALDSRQGRVLTILAKATVLATGGAGKAYLYTSNPDIATGDGVAMAYRVGAAIANMEFFQFHPTCLFHPHAKSFLISEAVRGEGAVLVNAKGRRFMEGVHPMAELAPRDIVARAIDHELKVSGEDCVYLDISHKPADEIRRHFPNITEKCAGLGIDITARPMPVVPAAHYMCGGIVADMHGESTIEGLFAIGEVACTGLHGANRLASNSLLEALVFADQAASRIRGYLGEPLPEVGVLTWDTMGTVESDEQVVVSHNWDELRRSMSNYVGIVRSDKRLERAARRIEMLQSEVEDYYWRYMVTSDLIELRNICTVARLIAESARIRRESRGLHYNLDCPERDDARWRRDTVLRRQVQWSDVRGVNYP